MKLEYHPSPATTLPPRRQLLLPGELHIAQLAYEFAQASLEEQQHLLAHIRERWSRWCSKVPLSWATFTLIRDFAPQVPIETVIHTYHSAWEQCEKEGALCHTSMAR